MINGSACSGRLRGEPGREVVHREERLGVLTEQGVQEAEVIGKVPKDWTERWKQKSLVPGLGAWGALPGEQIRSTMAELVISWVSLLRMTFPLVLCSFAVCFNNPSLPISQGVLFSCPDKAAAFITRANIAACASSFPFVMV